MSVYAMIVWVVAVVMAAGVLSSYFASNKSRTQSRAEIEALNQRVAQLEKRVTNVETIATSKDFHLRREFETLENE